MKSSLAIFRCGFLLLAVVIVSRAAWAAPLATLRIATYNVANMFDRYDDPYTEDSVPARGTSPKSARALYALARVIKAVNADVLLLQEVENRNFLAEFNAAYLDGLNYKYVVLLEGNNSHIGDRGIDVALLSRVPVYSATTYQYQQHPLPNGTSVRFSRDLLHVRIRPEGFPELHVFTLHAPSRLGGEAAAVRRITEATLAAKILREIFADNTNAWILVGGDFNDDETSASLAVFTSIPGVPLRRVPAVDARGGTATWISPSSGFEPATLDHLLLSPAAARYLVQKHAVIWNADPRLAEEASDHRPVYLDLRRPTRVLAK
ncbi:MAG: endonuclease/exonuclease/phosphatase family protein [bacterium]|nr:endonuclease/exonuclease/phosphatase family protein [bacterium]